VRVKDFEVGEKLRGRCGFYVARRKSGADGKQKAQEDSSDEEVLK
jgi:hypothetical protein